MQESVIYQDIWEEAEQKGLEKGLQQELQIEKRLVLRLLSRQLGQLPEDLVSQVHALSQEQVEDLGEALLDFEGQEDLVGWLEAHTDNPNS